MVGKLISVLKSYGVVLNIGSTKVIRMSQKKKNYLNSTMNQQKL